MPTAKMVGATVRRKEDPRLITGRGSFVPNLRLPGMLHACFVRSPHPHAGIVRIDTSAARAHPGVVMVLTGEDVKAPNLRMRWGPDDGGRYTRSKQPLALGIGPVGAAFFTWDIGMKRGDIQLLGVASYAAPLLSTLALVAAGIARPTWTIALAAVLIAGGAALAAKASARKDQ